MTSTAQPELKDRACSASAPVASGARWPFLINVAHKVLTQLSERFPETPFYIEFWNGETIQYGTGTPVFTMRIKSLAAARRIMRDGGMGLAEAYQEQEIDIDGDLLELIKFQYMPIFKASTLSLGEKVRAVLMAIAQRNTLTRVRQNVAHHYDLSHEFYGLWLDKSMTYTCAYFRKPEDSLDQAQNNKHEHICRKLRLEPGMTLIDIGCGWGAMMFYAAEHHGVRCVGYTISQEQYNWLQTEIGRRGMQGQVQVLLQDYRDAQGQFDRFVSIGMFEQVGREYIGAYMDMIRRVLKAGGVGLLHTIGHLREKFDVPWIRKYIFPGGYLPTLAELARPMNHRDLSIFDIEDLRLHYVQTLETWYRRFSEHVDTVRQMYGEHFVRTWKLYLKSAASSFLYGGCRLYQIAFTNGAPNQGPRTRAYLYDEAPQTAQFSLKSL